MSRSGLDPAPALLAALALLATIAGGARADPVPVGPPPPASAPPPGSKAPPSAALVSALALARSAEAADQESLLRSLDREEFLASLEAVPSHRRLPPASLRLGRVLATLVANPSPAARRTLVALTGARTFLDADDRAELLATTLAALRPPPPAVLRFWDEQSRPDAVATPFVIDALCANGSEEAVRLLEKRLADPRQDPDAKRSWIREAILEHRNDAVLLRGCSRMLATTLPAPLRPVLVEALFDYRPEWYGAETAPSPPDPRRASPAARAELRRIGRYALAHVRLTETQRRAVRRTLAKL